MVAAERVIEVTTHGSVVVVVAATVVVVVVVGLVVVDDGVSSGWVTPEGWVAP